MYICNKRGDKILNDLPVIFNKNNNTIDCKSMVGMCLDIEYKGEIYKNIKILDYFKSKHPQFRVEYFSNIKDVDSYHFLEGKFGNVFNVYDFKYKVNQTVGEIIITNTGFLKHKQGHNIKSYQIYCPNCKFDSHKHYRNGELIDEYWVVESVLKKGCGCPCCCNPSRVVVPEINSIWKTNHWMVELGVDEEFAKTHTSQSNEKAPCKCPLCGSIRHKKGFDIYRTKSIGCICGDGFSYPEKFMYNILKQLGVEFETQYSPDYLDRKRSDFHIPSLNLVIEVDGKLGHKGGIVHSKSKKTLEECIEIDQWKDEQHLKHGIKTIRINCFKSEYEYIKNNILKSELINCFDFDKVDWNKCEEFALSNLVKEVCDYWNNKEEWETTTDLVKIFKLSNVSILDYLKIGSKLKWCNYVSKYESRKTAIKNNKSKRKLVEVFLDDVSIGIFESAKFISSISLNTFGVFLDRSGISMACNGKIKQYKGFKFSFIK